MNNLDYFLYSLNHEEQIIDFDRPGGVVVINKNKDEEENNLVVSNLKLLNYIEEYKNIINIGKTNNERKVEILNNIISILENVENINYSPFCSYFQVLNYSYYQFKNKNTLPHSDKLSLIDKIVRLYIQNRHEIYKFHGYSNIVLQVMSDISSSRRKSNIGIEKIESFLKPLGFKKTNELEDFKKMKLSYILPDKGQLNLFNYILKEESISFKFRENREFKNPDILIKVNEHIFLIEHKIINGSGGAQNLELNEIIEFIKYNEENKNFHYVSCLDGNFFSKFKNSNEPKVVEQLKNVKNNLKICKNNFFVNNKGLMKLIFNYIDL